MDPFIVIKELVGLMGLICAVITFQCKKHRNVMIFRTLNELFFALQYFMLASYTGVAMNIVGSARNISFSYWVERGRSTKLLQILFSVFFVVFGLFTYAGLVSIMVIAAKVITTVAYGFKNTTLIRLLTIPTCTCWLIYNAYSGSAAGVMCEIFSLCSIVTALIRVDLIPYIRSKRLADSGDAIISSSMSFEDADAETLIEDVQNEKIK